MDAYDGDITWYKKKIADAMNEGNFKLADDYFVFFLGFLESIVRDVFFDSYKPPSTTDVASRPLNFTKEGKATLDTKDIESAFRSVANLFKKRGIPENKKGSAMDPFAGNGVASRLFLKLNPSIGRLNMADILPHQECFTKQTVQFKLGDAPQTTREWLETSEEKLKVLLFISPPPGVDNSDLVALEEFITGILGNQQSEQVGYVIVIGEPGQSDLSQGFFKRALSHANISLQLFRRLKTYEKIFEELSKLGINAENRCSKELWVFQVVREKEKNPELEKWFETIQELLLELYESKSNEKTSVVPVNLALPNSTSEISEQLLALMTSALCKTSSNICVSDGAASGGAEETCIW
jgi:hypothetical protein